MLLKIKAELEPSETSPARNLQSLQYENEICFADVERELVELCKPYLQNLGGTGARIILKSDISAEGKNKKLAVYLECPDLEENSYTKIHLLIRSIRNWIFSEFNPVYKEVLVNGTRSTNPRY